MRPSVGSSLTLPGTRRSWIKIWNDENGDTYVDWVLASRSERWSVPASV
jgi:hypothetical protein